ncbi:hypothetical protein GYMLUDRAFT_66140 [Collybiopsis luxurians FD-317 M1]|nr:hypothetical protein GYMLUDRAFT_66140 [Collybiopsis luxurians FD-317 M1]
MRRTLCFFLTVVRLHPDSPMEVSSKKPVTRRRIVVNIQTPQARDPRFLSMTGDFSSQKFRQNYGFLTESRKTELVTLRENLKRARKLLTSSPRDIKQEREVEVSRLELAMKRTESAVNKDRRDTIEQEALRDAKKLEQQKQQSGKGKWYMKNTEKKELFVKARYGALAEQGGQRAVKKSIEKKRKKIAQKEKRSRPFTKTDSESSRHSIPGSNHDRHREKRRKLN